ncbi:hypothetical protein IWW36_000422 [Coemansia brasiliensis]|uniref:Subtilisin-like protein n=1 Tax=Coemansia brasiliensis TaxID=2650707 RepID=A0A9W8M000_9FUNG|nr:hypothetical protein IWW36_000422 [Coemansia brasiliensis]
MQILALGALTVVSCLSILGVEAGRLLNYPPHVRTKRGAYIVEFESHVPSDHVSKFHAMPDIFVNHHYTKAFNGISVSTRSLDPIHLANVDGVKRVWPVRYYRPASFPPGASNSTDMYLHHVTGVEKALTELGLNGKGIKIGIIDTGVDYNHPELGACWKTEGCLWQYGQDFIGDKYTGANPVIDPNPTPMDCDGHGTHVAGILAGQGPEVHGVAPGATYGMYRVFSCPDGENTETADDIILRGLEAAHKDDHDIISMSLGSSGWPEEPLGVASAKLVEDGVVVVAAAGNDGFGGLQTTSAPAVAHGIISVGSVDNWNITAKQGIITSDQGSKSIMVSTPGNANYTFDFDSDVPLAFPDSNGANFNGCSKFSDDLVGKIAFVKRGDCSFNEKLTNAYEAGANGVLCYNNEPGLLGPSITVPVPIPFVLIGEKDGAYIADRLAAGSVSIKSPKGQYEIFSAETGGQMSSFSSYGPSAELNMYPLISAPGGNIWSTYLLKDGGYASLSGTSMATPYISGTVALIKQARPELSVEDITRLLVSTGKPITDPSTNLKFSPFRSGGGLVSVYDAIQSRVRFDPPVLSINDSKVGPINGDSKLTSLGTVRWAARTITICNHDSKKNMKISLDNMAGNSMSTFLANGSFTYTPRIWPSDATGNVPEDTVPQIYSFNGQKIIKPGQSTSVTVFIVAPKGLKDTENWYYGGFIDFTVQWQGEKTESKYNIPYGGYNGDYSAQKVLSPVSDGLPSILDDSTGNPIQDLSTLVIKENVTASLLYGLSMPSRLVEVKMVNSDTGESVGYLYNGYLEYVPKTCPQCAVPFVTTTIWSYASTDKEGKDTVEVPAGKYHALLRALLPRGDINNDNDYQVWKSGDFTVA